MSSNDQPRVSLRDVAKAVGLSHVAVSLALRDSPRVSEERRAEIRAVAERMGYRPDPMLSSLVAYRRQKQSATFRSALAWINQWQKPDMLRSFKEFDQYWQGANAAAEHLGYRIEEFRWPLDRPARRLQTILETRGVRGLLVPPQAEGFKLEGFDFSRFSIVRFGSSARSLRAHTITSDQSHCARLCYERARELGYRRIGYITSTRFERNTLAHFREGYLNAQEELGERKNHIPPVSAGEEGHGADREVAAWLRRHKPDAVITTLGNCDQLLARLGIRVPQDLAVAVTSVLDGAFDTGADQNSYEIGRVAVSMINSLIIESERGLPGFQRRILVEGRWIQGQSMPPRTAAT